jgi:uncharacterized membrane protein YfcA
MTPAAADPAAMTAAVVLGYLLIGTVSGFFAGLLGIGGGVILVPAFAFAFGLAGFDQGVIFQAALATSMATILFTAISSVRSHHGRGGVLWPVVRRFTPGVLVGTAVGTWIVGVAPTAGLISFFAVFLLFVRAQLAFDLRPRAERSLPGVAGLTTAGGLIGMVSALAAVGGGSMTVPFLVWCNVEVRKAIGTAAATGFPIAVGGTLGYIVNGWGVAAMPEASLGYIYLPALFWTVLTAVLTAPLGARAAHVLPGRLLRRVFAALLVMVAVRMLMAA